MQLKLIKIYLFNFHLFLSFCVKTEPMTSKMSCHDIIFNPYTYTVFPSVTLHIIIISFWTEQTDGVFWSGHK